MNKFLLVPSPAEFGAYICVYVARGCARARARSRSNFHERPRTFMDVMAHFRDVNFRRVCHYCPPSLLSGRRSRSRGRRECFLLYISGLAHSPRRQQMRALTGILVTRRRAREARAV